MTTLTFKIYKNQDYIDTLAFEGQPVIKIGRLPSSAICLDVQEVARLHAVIETNGEEIRVIDLGTERGTFVNGKKVEKNAPLKSGDIIRIGPFSLRLLVGEVSSENENVLSEELIFDEVKVPELSPPREEDDDGPILLLNSGNVYIDQDVRQIVRLSSREMSDGKFVIEYTSVSGTSLWPCTLEFTDPEAMAATMKKLHQRRAKYTRK